MSILSNSKHLFLAGLVSFSALFTSCSKPQRIGPPEAKSDVSGMTVADTLGGSSIQRIVIEGYKLQEGQSYECNCHLRIDGDVPKNTSITTTGQIEVNGNIKDDVSLNAQVPTYGHDETIYVTTFIQSGTTMIPIMNPITSYVPDGPQEPFGKEPVIAVNGKVGKDVKFYSAPKTFIKTTEP